MTHPVLTAALKTAAARGVPLLVTNPGSSTSDIVREHLPNVSYRLRI
jgi:hypothetical protein